MDYLLVHQRTHGERKQKWVNNVGISGTVETDWYGRSRFWNTSTSLIHSGKIRWRIRVTIYPWRGGFHLTSLVRQLWFLLNFKYPWNKFTRYFSCSWTKHRCPLLACNTDGESRRVDSIMQALLHLLHPVEERPLETQGSVLRAHHAQRMTQRLHFYRTATSTRLKQSEPNNNRAG